MSLGLKEHNEWVRRVIDDCEWEPLKDFLGKLLEPEDEREQPAGVPCKEVGRE